MHVIARSNSIILFASIHCLPIETDLFVGVQRACYIGDNSLLINSKITVVHMQLDYLETIFSINSDTKTPDKWLVGKYKLKINNNQWTLQEIVYMLAASHALRVYKYIAIVLKQALAVN